MKLYLALAAVSGFLAVAIGAFGAHGIQDQRAKELIDIGVKYQMFHTLAVLLIAWLSQREGVWASPLWLAGIVLFSGSLYAMAFGAPRMLGMVTPIGGVFFLAGWAALLIGVLRR